MKKILIAIILFIATHYTLKFIHEFFEKTNFCRDCKIYTECNKVESWIDTYKGFGLFSHAKIFCINGVLNVKSLTYITGGLSTYSSDPIQFIEVTYPNEKPLRIYSVYYWPDKFTEQSLYKVIFKPPYIFFETEEPNHFYGEFTCRKYNVETRELEIDFFSGVCKEK